MAINAGDTTYYQAKRGIVQDGLVLNLDAAVDASYPGNGTTWYDLAGSNSGTLTNGPTFDRGNGGGIVFDGTDDYVNLGTASSLFPGPNITASLFCWIKPSTVGSSSVPIGNLTSGHRLYIGIYSGGFWDVGFGNYYWNYAYSGSRATATTNWTLISLIITAGSAVLYVNGQKTITKTTDTSVSLGGFFSMGVYLVDGSIYGSYQESCNIALIQIYNRALSANEVQQNYNATKGRFE